MKFGWWAGWWVWASVAAAAPGAPLKTVSLAYIGEQSNAGLIDSPRYLAVLEAAVNLAVEDQRARLKKVGIDIQLKHYYSIGVGAASYRTTKEALEGDTVAAVGLSTSDEALAGAPLLKGTDYVLVSPFSSSTELLQHQPNLLTMIASNQELASAIETFIRTRYDGKRVTSVVAWDSAYAQNLYRMMSEKFRAGSALVRVFSNLSDLDEVVRSAMSTRPEIVFLPNFPVVTSALIGALTRAGFRGTFIGGDTWGEGIDLRTTKILAGVPYEGFSLREFSIFMQSPGEKELQKRLARFTTEKYPSQASSHYDATRYLLDRIAEIGPGVTRQAMLEATKGERFYKGVRGKYCLSAIKCPHRRFAMVHVKNGKYDLEGEFHPAAVSE